MKVNTESFADEISGMLAAAGEDFTAKSVDLGIYGITSEITKHGSDRTLHLTPVEDGLISLVLYDKAGDTIASGTLFDKIIENITPERLTNLIAICF